MKTPRQPQNAHRTPLNQMLGTEAAVRLLRVLAFVPDAVAAGELARRAHLGRTSVYPALDALEETGIVEFTGVGAQRHARLNRDHPLAKPIVTLFQAEARRVDAMVDELRHAFTMLPVDPASAWLEGLAGSDADNATALALWFVADPKSIAALTEVLQGPIEQIERVRGVQIEIHGLTRSEFETRSRSGNVNLDDALLLAGVPPTALLPARLSKRSKSAVSHPDHDVSARRLAVAIAARLRKDPTLRQAALELVRRRAAQASPGELKELNEWRRVLRTMAPRQLEQFLVDSGERATRLRQTLPALGLLTPAQRDKVLAARSDDEARAAVLST